MSSIFLLGGTLEGRRLYNLLGGTKIEAKVFVATEYGSDLLPSYENTNIMTGRLDEQGFINAIRKERPDLVIDATHPDAVLLLQANCKKFHLGNVEIIQGAAPEALCDLPAPDCVFIGGSRGKLPEIIEQLMNKNGKVRIVIPAITLETVNEALALLGGRFNNTEIVQLSVARAKRAGAYHMMRGQNPVFIISGGGYAYES